MDHTLLSRRFYYSLTISIGTKKLKLKETCTWSFITQGQKNQELYK